MKEGREGKEIRRGNRLGRGTTDPECYLHVTVARYLPHGPGCPTETVVPLANPTHLKGIEMIGVEGLLTARLPPYGLVLHLHLWVSRQRQKEDFFKQPTVWRWKRFLLDESQKFPSISRHGCLESCEGPCEGRPAEIVGVTTHRLMAFLYQLMHFERYHRCG